MSVPELETALAVLRHAIRNEIAGQRFYHDASFFCIDPWAKDLFSSLAREEDEHAQLLLGEYRALERTGQWIDPAQALESGAGVEITHLTFSSDELEEQLFPSEWSVGDLVDRRTDDLTALALGVRMEQEAIDLYSREGSNSPDPAARRAYAFLVEEEIRHYDQLREQWERLAGRPFSGI